MRFQKEHLLLYAVTDRSLNKNLSLLEQTEKALQGGITMLQLREKNLDEKTFLEEAIMLKELCHTYHVPLIINDNLSVAQKSRADGIHVGIEDTPVCEIRKIMGNDFIIGATAKTVEQARRAEAEGADYLGTGAVFASPTKKNAIRITKEQLHEICTSVSIPAVAIGGITAENVMEIEGGGMCGIAVVSAVFGAKDITAATADLKEKAVRIIERRTL